MKASGEIRDRLNGVKWVSMENLHITLKFLGEIDNKQLQDVKSVIKEVASDEKAFSIKGGYLGAFPSLEKARVVFFGLESGKAEVMRLFDKLEHKLAKNGFLREQKPYHPHITIGRAKRRVYDLRPFRETRVEFLDRVDSIVLFKSTLRPEGPVYEVIYRGELSRNG